MTIDQANASGNAFYMYSGFVGDTLTIDPGVEVFTRSGM